MQVVGKAATHSFCYFRCAALVCCFIIRGAFPAGKHRVYPATHCDTVAAMRPRSAIFVMP